MQVDPAPEHLPELVPQGEEGQARDVTWLELDQDVNVAVRSKVTPQDRAEKRQPADVVLAAERRYISIVDTNVRAHRLASPILHPEAPIGCQP